MDDVADRVLAIFDALPWRQNERDLDAAWGLLEALPDGALDGADPERTDAVLWAFERRQAASPPHPPRPLGGVLLVPHLPGPAPHPVGGDHEQLAGVCGQVEVHGGLQRGQGANKRRRVRAL